LHPPHATLEALEEYCAAGNIPVMVIVKASHRDGGHVRVCALLGVSGVASV
jgi:hypothetical protein